MRNFGFNLQGEGDYKKWQDLILEETNIECSVVVTSHTISIRADSYADYLLARSVVVKRTGLEVVRG